MAHHLRGMRVPQGREQLQRALLESTKAGCGDTHGRQNKSENFSAPGFARAELRPGYPDWTARVRASYEGQRAIYAADTVTGMLQPATESTASPGSTSMTVSRSIIMASFDYRTRAGAEKFGPNHTTPLACASAQSPQAQGGARRGPHWRSSFRCRNLRCATHSTVYAKNAKSVVSKESRAHCLCANSLRSIYLLDQNNFGYRRGFRKHFEKECKVRTRLTYPGTQSTVSTQSTPIPRTKITPAGRGPCELGWELRDQALAPNETPEARAGATVVPNAS